MSRMMRVADVGKLEPPDLSAIHELGSGWSQDSSSSASGALLEVGFEGFADQL